MNKLIIVLILIFTSSLFYVQALDLREDKNYAKDDPKAYAPYENHNPEVNKLIFKKASSHLTAQHIWTYNKEFAKRFGMPKRWVDDNLKGALALAYRNKTTNNRWCGYFGDWNNCKELDNQCLLDVYVKNDNKNIPWNTSENLGRYYSRGAHSIRFLKLFRNTEYEIKKYKDKNGRLPNWYYFGPEGQKDYDNLMPLGKNSNIGIDSIGWAHRFKSDGFGEGSGGYVTEFHRNVLVGIDVITIGGMCNFARSGDGEMQVWLSGGNKEISKKLREYNKRFTKNGTIRRHKNMKVAYKIYPGQSFMQRVKVYDTQNEGNSFFNFFKQNINQQPTK